MARTTKVQVVNTMLSAIGEAPINSITGDANALVSDALRIIDEVNRELQGQGWHWNITESYELSPDADGFIAIPQNVLRLDARPTSVANYVQRGDRLYDYTNSTYEFTAAVTLDVIVELPWDELPEQARNYIMVRACRRFVDRQTFDNSMHSFTLQDEYMAKAMLLDHELETADWNYIRGSRLGLQILGGRNGVDRVNNY